MTARPPPVAAAAALLVTADGGGSDAARSRLWKVELQQLADDLRLTVRVCHVPPGTGKGDKIEHRLFSHISRDWRGRPLAGRELTVRLVGATTTATGPVVKADVDRGQYPTGRTVSDAELAAVRRVPDPFHGAWNYRIGPRAKL